LIANKVATGHGTKNPFLIATRHLQAWLVITALSFAWNAPVSAQTNDGEPHSLALLKFATGMISAYALHETGHALAAGLTGTELEWGIGTYNQPLGFTEYAKSDNAGMIVHGAGLTTQVIGSEIILQSEAIDKNDSFVRGMMFWNIINPVIYALDYWVFKRTNYEDGDYYQGDLKGFEHYSDEKTANGFAALMAGVAIFQGYRFVKVQDWAPDWIGSNTMQLNFQPSGRDGAALTIQIAF
jgi:hypothetical protein